MDCEVPSCSSSFIDNQGMELTELTLEQGINVWGANQHILEEQALHELDILAHENSTTNLEDGEIVDNKEIKAIPALDINSYIKRQQELKKIQDFKKTLHTDVTDKSRATASKISKQQGKKLKRRKCAVVVENAPCQEVKCEKETDISHEEEIGSGSEYVPSEGSDVEFEANPIKRRRTNPINKNIDKVKDDGSMEYFKTRLEEYYKTLEMECSDDELEYEYYTIKGGLKIPFKIWNRLYDYQKDGVRWLWQIHQKTTGGILGDEMGLGKTVQVIAFLAALEYSKIISKHDCFRGLGPTVIVCPATVIHQWVKHFHDWAPEFRVAILHQSGTFQGNKTKLIKEINKGKGILITSYLSVLKYKDILQDHNWHYLILDEGHKIRNPNAKVSKAVKQIRTPFRLMLTGSPMQNNLQELWSLFDFTNPDMLGNLTTFMEHFNNPIIQGGFANATPMQEATALSVATTLKNVISPFLLRRSKNEVQDHISLPNKSEQVLFCSLTEEQRDLYKGYLMSDSVGSILGKDSRNWFSENQTRANVLIGITTLRKICNHPDIYLGEADAEAEADDDDTPLEEKFGYYKKSGKMIVVSALLKIWKKQKHRVLLFTQSRVMISIFEAFLNQQEYKYLKMDGGTAVSSRQPLINKFNEDSSYDVFLLTTRVGGLGVNLTGANRVIIYDPDWNPATDTQARERAWRIGQNKQVTIYRLLSAGTIEEKIYQRQVWKQLLSNKVLLDPKTQRFFKSSNLHDLFSLPDGREASNPETANIFRDSRVKLQEKLRGKRKRKTEVRFSEGKIEEMKKLAQQIAKSMSAVKEDAPRKTAYQVELEEERRRKLEEKQELKKLTPLELMQLNRERTRERPESPGNRVDGCHTEVSFSQALEYSEKTAKLYTELKAERVDKVDNVAKEKKRDKKAKQKELFKSVVDDSGTIDGEKVDGLIKTEIKKIRKKHDRGLNTNENQDQYVLEKLFSKKGVSTVLQHDSIVESNLKTTSLKVQTEAEMRADRALEALRKSRLDKWRW